VWEQLFPLERFEAARRTRLLTAASKASRPVAGTAEFSECQSVGHQVRAPQVVDPQAQVMFNGRTFSDVKLRSGQAGFQVLHGITNGCGQAIG
jgi:hypothetical protein